MALAMAIFLALAACETSPSDADAGVDSGPTSDVARPPDTLDAVDAVTGATTKKWLDDAHAGWAKPACWTCHTPDEHSDGLDPYLCVTCHGTNGAGSLPGNHGKTGCLTCHGDGQHFHAPEGFTAPLSCLTCHPEDPF
jgi:hypothetical protein